MVTNLSKRRVALPFVLAGIAVLVAAISGGIACNEGEQAPANTASGVEGTLSLGDSTELAAVTIAESGGTITVGDEGGALEGLALQVAEDSYDAPRDFAISFRPITGHDYDDRINPISPLITVENGGDYADRVMSVKVPVQVPDGHFAMGFFYDGQTGELEGMPLLDDDGASITVGTRHFSDFFISSILESVLLNITVDSGFRPGVDDWQFANYGSYAAQGGHCAGQSIAAMWYYYERKLKGEPALYGRYDNYLSDEEQTPDLWEDDNLAYRLASTVHSDLHWDTLGFNLFLALEGTNDPLQMLAFAYALHVTHAPQFVGLTDTVNGGGHAIIGYKVEGGNIWVADPNYPGVKSAEGKIEYVDGAFRPYRSAPRADSDPTSYDKIGYYAVSAMVDWEAVGARFAEMESGAVGDEYFPAYALRGLSLSELAEAPLVDGVAFPDNKFAVREPGSDWRVGVYRAGNQLGSGRGEVVTLQPGDNKLGIALSRETGKKDRDGKDILGYVDFYRVTVVYNQVEISPNPVTGNAGDDLRMTATMPARVENARYVWDYGDGTPNEDLSLSSMHVWAEAGEYPVNLSVYDAKDRLIGLGQAVAKIGASTGTPAKATTPTLGGPTPCRSGDPGSAATVSDSFGDPADAFMSYSISGVDFSQDTDGDYYLEGQYTGSPITLSGTMVVSRPEGTVSYVSMHASVGDQSASWPPPGEDSKVSGRVVEMPYNLTFTVPKDHDCSSPITGGVLLEVCGGACGRYEISFVVTMGPPEQ